MPDPTTPSNPTPTGTVDIERPAIPDLEFLPPDCPICAGSLEYDADGFDCARCQIFWGLNGRGSDAVSHRAEEGLCEARCPNIFGAWVWEGEFCHLPAGHEVDGSEHEIDPERARKSHRDEPVRWADAPDAPGGDQ
ncbi:MAG TPA: hypothetical protein VGW74_06985 [Propionibacteriaceae bacterium]|nr:hypothetical protein [Propionibacteriaceae bacterium]